MNSIEQHHITV